MYVCACDRVLGVCMQRNHSTVQTGHLVEPNRSCDLLKYTMNSNLRGTLDVPAINMHGIKVAVRQTGSLNSGYENNSM